MDRLTKTTEKAVAVFRQLSQRRKKFELEKGRQTTHKWKRYQCEQSFSLIKHDSSVASVSG